MIQRIGRSHQVSQQITKYLTILKEQGFSGDLTTSYAERLSMATDNSIYQLLPQAVVYPRSTSDVQLLAKLATDKQFQSLTFTPRGSGTGTCRAICKKFCKLMWHKNGLGSKRV